MTTPSLVVDQTLSYPDDATGFSPDEDLPEDRFKTVSPRPNSVYRAVRRCFAQAGLDGARYGSAQWNPLGEFVGPGSNVLVLPNFVQHRRSNETWAQFHAKCTHASVLRPIVDYLLLATGSTGTVTIGNAPIQSARWPALLRDTGTEALMKFYAKAGVGVTSRDLRLYVTERGRAGNVRHVERRSDVAGVTVDLGAASLLSELGAEAAGRFRVADYDPSRTARFHSAGRHSYVISRTAFDADVIVSVPKLKTHAKVGLTCGLKGFVGAIGHKDCLAHHRYGPPQAGGDEYPRDPLGALRTLSALHDRVQRTAPSSLVGSALRVVDRVVRHVSHRLVPSADGSWFGNDTAWRMALDIARILEATPGPRRDASPRRRHLMLVDGVVGGERAGPLAPKPVLGGILLFIDDVALGDWICARLMGFDPNRVPLVRQAFADRCAASAEAQGLIVNSVLMPLEEALLRHARSFEPPPGWRGNIEFERGAWPRSASQGILS